MNEQAALSRLVVDGPVVPAPRLEMPVSTAGTARDLAPQDAVYGLLRLADVDVALPLDVLREVVRCPVDLDALPTDAPGLLGAMNLRGTVLPVVDLRPAIGRDQGRAADQVVVVVARNGQAIGVVADEVRGVIRLGASALVPVAATGGGLVFSHTFQHPEDGSVVSLLDADAVMRRPGVPTVADTTSEITAPVAKDLVNPAGPVRTLTLLRCGPHLLALDIAQVHTTIPPPAIRSSVMDSVLCPGVTDFAGREVPVVDLLSLVGLGSMDRTEIGAGLVLDLGHGFVVLALGELLDLVEVAAEELLPLPSFAASEGRLLVAVADLRRTSSAVSATSTSSCLVIDGEALMSAPSLTALASVNSALDGAALSRTTSARATSTAAGAGPAYLAYAAGADLVTALEQVQEILPFPAEMTAAPGIDGLLGVIVHRQTVVPILGLSELLGRGGGRPGPSSCLLVVAVDDEPVAFAVDRLNGIELLTWADPDHVVGRQVSSERLLAATRLVQVGAEPRLLPELDLAALARSLRPVQDRR